MQTHAHDTGSTGVAHLHTDEGLRAAVIGTAGLLLTGAIELVVFAASGSAGLLADAFHNLGDVSTTVVIAIAFLFSRRQASERYPYGLHRAEDLAGLFVVLVMAASAIAAGWESVRHLTQGERPDHLIPGMAAALIGVAGNEAVAQYKVRVGRRIRSVSLEADGQHSRQDGLVSLAAFLGLAGVALGFGWADGVAGLLITAVIVLVLITTARDVLRRALDAVEPELIRQIATVAAAVPGVEDAHDVRARWAGRALWASLSIVLPAELPLGEAHAVAERVRHRLLHETDGLVGVDIHMDPSRGDEDYHAETAHHLAAATGAGQHAHEARAPDRAKAAGGHERAGGHRH